ncbi:FUN14 domain-containing protein 1-like [Dendronephthya gigantea]|uniref:FUN14 domain-containing protein 1-like n=1 Tax=Dendronephthya gigantea TaxID=151771 RepID=UPI00106D730F|nr:FUN14 domain-containing protein 1-like [Dendronephthya gigantea]
MASENGVDDEKKPAEDEELDDVDGYKVIRVPGFGKDTYWDVAVRRLGELDLSRRPVYQQVGAGGITGWFVGNIFKKVGKVTALAIGGGLLVLQLASQSGYVTINWKKINKDVGKVSKNVSEKFGEYTSSRKQQSKIAKYFNKGGQVVQKNVVVASGFAAGFLLGLAT